MTYAKKLGIFVRVPEPGRVKTRLVPPLTAAEASTLYAAFVSDLAERLQKLKKVAVTVFYSGGDPAPLRTLLPARYGLVAQRGDTLGERLRNAFAALLDTDTAGAVVVGSDSPDLPLQFVKRAFVKLKHKAVVIGPASDGGYYLLGLRQPMPELFEGLAWGTDAVLEQTLSRIAAAGVPCSMLPLWYDVDDEGSVALLRSMLLGRRIEGSGRLRHTERVLETLAHRLNG